MVSTRMVSDGDTGRLDDHVHHDEENNRYRVFKNLDRATKKFYSSFSNAVHMF